MKRWWSMVGKEWRGTWTLLAVATAATVAFDIWLGIKTATWSLMHMGEGLAVGLSFIPFAGVGIATVVAGYFAMRGEWQSHTSMRTLSYPLSGTAVLTSKLAVILFNLVLVTLVAAAGVWFVASRTPGFRMMMTSDPTFMAWVRSREFLTSGIWVTISGILGIAFMVAVGMFSFVIGTLVPRISGLIAVAVHVLVWYLCFAFGPHAMYVASFLPNPVIVGFDNALDLVRRIEVPLLPLWPTLAVTAVLLLVAGRILESEVDA
ncbi:MAG TPA: hypothetical protein DCL63_12660 [Firmicutes bacterium]|nr:hypothetical protein [Bacillota bacterium]